MESAADIRNRTFGALRQDVVRREDGRYLIYYSLPGDEATDASAAAGAQARPPDQQPWAPDRQPDV